MSDQGVIWERATGRIVDSKPTLRGAKIAFTRKYGTQEAITVTSWDEYAKTGAVTADEMVTVKSIMGTGKEVQIRRADVGSCCDPSTERYWSM